MFTAARTASLPTTGFSLYWKESATTQKSTLLLQKMAKLKVFRITWSDIVL
jgi:hypothetical protein